MQQFLQLKLLNSALLTDLIALVCVLIIAAGYAIKLWKAKRSITELSFCELNRLLKVCMHAFSFIFILQSSIEDAS